MARLNVHDIIDILEQTFDLTWDEILDSTRDQDKVYARYLFTQEMRDKGVSYAQIGRALRRDTHFVAWNYMNNYTPPPFLCEFYGDRFKELKRRKMEGLV